jgi:hypothetical protein
MVGIALGFFGIALSDGIGHGLEEKLEVVEGG